MFGIGALSAMRAMESRRLSCIYLLLTKVCHAIAVVPRLSISVCGVGGRSDGITQRTKGHLHGFRPRLAYDFHSIGNR